MPALLPCYLIPALFNTVGLVDGHASKLYPMARDYLLPTALVLLTVAVDFGAIVRLGPKALILFLTGTASVMLGGVVAAGLQPHVAVFLGRGAGHDVRAAAERDAGAAPVGVLLAVLGYGLGTYGAYLTGLVLQALAG